MSEKIKAADAVWITNRLPTKDDADREGTVWITRDSVVERMAFLNVFQRQAWMPIDEPPPYQPPAPEPDTSLAASIETLDNPTTEDVDGVEWIKATDAYLKARSRVIAAARRWDDSIRTTTELAEAVADDPDGVGDGWRLLRDGEVIRKGDQFETCGRWYDTHDSGMTRFGTATRRRRRIEAVPIQARELTQCQL